MPVVALALLLPACRSDAVPARATPSTTVTTIVEESPIVLEPEAPEEPTAPLAPGQQEFADYCAACHQPDGQGQEGGPPPLVGSPWVRGSEARLVRIVLHGLGGPIELGGVVYNLEMPAFGPLFSDDQIAAVLSYVRREYGAPSPPVEPGTVASIRADTAEREEYWTVAELETIP